MLRLGVVVMTVCGLAACAHAGNERPVAAGATSNVDTPTAVAPAPSPVVPSSAAPSKSVKASPTKKPTPHPSTTLKKTVAAGGDTGGLKSPPPTGDGVPQLGSGTFTVASGGTDIVGTGSTLVKYRVEVENGIVWGSNPVWTPAHVADVVDTAIAGPRGWTMSAAHPVTYGPEKLTNMSWSFQRVSGDDYSVRLRLATPGTVDKLCGQVGVTTQGVYSCRYGQTILLNLRRWLKGIPQFPADTTFHDNTINHEMGHFLGFAHMKCPGAGQPAPIMQTQTIALNGCTLNSFPFLADGTFVSGPWAPS